MANNGNNHLDREAVVSSLARFRQMWEAGVDGGNLIEAYASVGMVLGDIVQMLNLTSTEQRAILGEDLRKALFHEIRTRYGGDS